MEPDSRPAQPVVLVATALGTDKDGRIPLVRNLGTWWLPGGRVEPGESFIAAAARETEEETSLSFKPAGIAHVAHASEPGRRVIYVTVCGAVTGELEAPVADPKISAVRWATPMQVTELVPGYGRLWRELLVSPTIAEMIEGNE